MKLVFTICLLLLSEIGNCQFLECVKDITPLNDSSPREFVIYNNKLFFVARNNEYNIWQTDGTEIGTTMLPTNLRSGLPPQYLTVCNNKLFFVVGISLYVTDGTGPGTIKLASFKEYFGNLKAVDSLLFFMANDSLHGSELWISDGSIAGTKMVKDIFPGIDGGVGSSSVSYQHKLFFSDGTDTGTHALVTKKPKSIAFFNNRFHFATNTTNLDNGLWTTDGTDSGTTQLFTNLSNTGTTISRMTVFNNWLILIANDGTNGNEFWISDGTSINTIKPVFNNTIGNNPFPATGNGDFIEYKGSLYFAASYNNLGNELWRFSFQPLAINQPIVKNAAFSIFPNPAGSELNVIINQKQTLYIKDLFGRTVLTQYLEKSCTINVSNLTVGNYFISSSVAGNSIKFIKQ